MAEAPANSNSGGLHPLGQTHRYWLGRVPRWDTFGTSGLEGRKLVGVASWSGGDPPSILPVAERTVRMCESCDSCCMGCVGGTINTVVLQSSLIRYMNKGIYPVFGSLKCCMRMPSPGHLKRMTSGKNLVGLDGNWYTAQHAATGHLYER